MTIKQTLEKYIKNSEALKTLPAADRTEKVKRLMTAAPETMREFINVFKNEQKRLNAIYKKLLKHENEINGMKQHANVKKQKQILKKEHDVKRIETKYVDNLLNKLDKID